MKMKRVFSVLGTVSLAVMLCLSVSAAPNIPEYELGVGHDRMEELVADVVLDDSGVHYTASNTVKGDGTEEDTYLIFKEPLKLDGLKVTYTVDDDVFMGTGRDHWFAFSFIGSKIVFPYGMPGQNKMTDKTQGFAVRMVPDNDNINILVDRFDKALGFGAAEINTGMMEPKTAAVGEPHVLLFKVVGSDVFLNLDEEVGEDGDYYWHQIAASLRYFENGEAYLGMSLLAGVDADGKQKPMTFSVNNIELGAKTSLVEAPASEAPSSGADQPGDASKDASQDSSSGGNPSDNDSILPLVIGIVVAVVVIAGVVTAVLVIKRRKS